MSATLQNYTEQNVAIISIFMSNIPIEIPRYQGMIVEQFLPEGATHYQILSRKTHGEQIDECLQHLNHEIFLLLDIDAFPMSQESLQHVIEIAKKGELCGNMQVSAHLNSNVPFLAPSFMCFGKRIFDSLGQPSFCPDESNDVGEIFTRLAKGANIPIHFFRPMRVVGELKWKLDSDTPNCGPGTFFGTGTHLLNYHQYEIRKASSHTMFLREALRILDLNDFDLQTQHVDAGHRSKTGSFANRLGVLFRRLGRKAPL